MAGKPWERFATQGTGDTVEGTPVKRPWEKFAPETPEPELDTKGWERLQLGVVEGGAITTNMWDYAVSHMPFLAEDYGSGFKEEGDDPLRLVDAREKFGDDFLELSPQQRRDRMKEVRAVKLQENHAEALRASELMAERGEVDGMRLLGNVTKGVADPVAWVPVLGTAAKAKQAAGIGQKIVAGTKEGTKQGAVFGGLFGASEELADTGVPTTAEEGVDFAKTTATHAGIGAAGGAVLGGSIVGLSQVPRATQRARVARTLRSPSEAEKLSAKYQQYMLEAKAQGTPERPVLGADAHKSARERLGMTPDDVYKMSRITEEPIRTPATSAEAAETLGYIKLADGTGPAAGVWAKLARPIDTRLREVFPQGYGKLMGMETESFRKMHEYHRQTIPFRDMFRKFNKKDRKILGRQLYNKDFKTASASIEARFGREGVEKFDKMVTALTELGKEAQASGIKFDFIDHYFPRIIKDIDGLKEYIGSHPELGSYAKALAKAQKAREGGTPLSGYEEIKILNRMLEDRGGRVAKSVGSAKQRRIETITEEMLQFYDDPITSIDLHIKDVTAAIARRKFFGKAMKESDDGLEILDDSIGALLADSGIEPGSRQADEIASILKSRFGKGEDGGNKKLSTIRSGISGLVLGNPVSGALQLTDVGVTSWVKGLGNTLRGLPRASLETLKGTLGVESSKMNADTMGWMMEMAQELDTTAAFGSNIRKLSDGLMRYGGFKAFDRFGKNVTIQASLRKATNQLKSNKGTKKFLDEWASVYDGEELTTLMADLKAGRVTDIVKQHIFSEVTETQPISRSQMPQSYLDIPNGRIWYQFKTWGLKQLEVARNRVLKNLFSLSPKKQARGAKEAALMFTYIGSAGVGVKEAQSWMLGRDSVISNADELTDEAFWAVMGNMLFSRYGIQNLTERGDWKGMVTNYTAPPALIIPGEIAINAGLGIMGDDEATKKLMARVPTVGKFIDNWFLGGAEEFNEKLRTKRTEKVLGTDYADED